MSGSGSATFCHTLPVSEVGTDISGFLGSPPGTERAVSSQQAAQTPSPLVYSNWFKFQVLLMMVVSHVKRGEPIAIYWTQFQTLCYVELRNPTWESNPRPLGRQSHLRPLDQRRSLLFITIYFLIFSMYRMNTFHVLVLPLGQITGQHPPWPYSARRTWSAPRRGGRHSAPRPTAPLQRVDVNGHGMKQ
ncbi:hypothetical protein SFRURICE_004973 [Spodoptera frugiperda]|nr:hypothetical protein SFRURICE_004973 [Spodoptera frugiperda]